MPEVNALSGCHTDVVIPAFAISGKTTDTFCKSYLLFSRHFHESIFAGNPFRALSLADFEKNRNLLGEIESTAHQFGITQEQFVPNDE
tara:strand:+ start:731 stop:994 length:264 start_codon:yes stop_codon:yes gene_type:complete